MKTYFGILSNATPQTPNESNLALVSFIECNTSPDTVFTVYNKIADLNEALKTAKNPLVFKLEAEEANIDKNDSTIQAQYVEIICFFVEKDEKLQEIKLNAEEIKSITKHLQNKKSVPHVDPIKDKVIDDDVSTNNSALFVDADEDDLTYSDDEEEEEEDDDEEEINNKKEQQMAKKTEQLKQKTIEKRATKRKLFEEEDKALSTKEKRTSKNLQNSSTNDDIYGLRAARSILGSDPTSAQTTAEKKEEKKDANKSTTTKVKEKAKELGEEAKKKVSKAGTKVKEKANEVKDTVEDKLHHKTSKNKRTSSSASENDELDQIFTNKKSHTPHLKLKQQQEKDKKVKDIAHLSEEPKIKTNKKRKVH